ncbi:MAG: glycosyltransferase family 4 protein [Burkholderiaceae bacterium]
MRILYLDHYIGSLRHGMEFRPYYIAREWVRMGHQVTMVGASYAHVRSRQPDVRGDVTAETIDGIDYLWLATPPYEGNGMQRMRNMIAYVRALYRLRNRFVAGKPDVVIASSTYPWDIYPARSIARRAGARLAFEVHDLWPMSPMEIGGLSRWHPFIVAIQHGEDYACRHADVIVSILPHADRHLVTRGMPHQRYVHVPNGIDFDEWDGDYRAPPNEATRLVDSLRAQGRLLIGYAGSHSPGNALDTVIELASRVQDQPVAFVMIGGGPSKAELIQAAQQKSLNNVHFCDPVPKRDVPDLLRQFDALYYGLIPSPLYRYGISANKLFDYMAAARPVIQSNNASNDVVGDAQCGFSVGPNDVQALTRVVRELVSMTPAQRDAMGANGERYVRAHHDHRVLARRFLDAIAKH